MANLIILFPKMVKKSSKIRQVTKFHHQKQTACNMEGLWVQKTTRWKKTG
jgi:hypothetical protein